MHTELRWWTLLIIYQSLYISNTGKAPLLQKDKAGETQSDSNMNFELIGQPDWPFPINLSVTL